jgi:hypothetical protein
LFSILEHFILLIIVFLIEDKEGAPSTTAVLVLNTNFISFEVGSELEQVLVAVNVGADVRDEGYADFGKQVDDFDLVAQVVVDFGSGTPIGESILLAKLLCFIIDQHEDDIGIGILRLHVGDNFRVFKQFIYAGGARDALVLTLLEGCGNGDEGVCAEVGVVTCDHLKVGVVVVNVEHGGTVERTHVEEALICVFEEGQ